MCGLVGIAGGNPARHEVERMLETIRHRGPDGEGVHLADGAAFGHVRLAIVDPSSAGAQPMLSPDGRYCLAYNGECYNHRDFRPELEADGVHFRGHSDTETLLWLLILRGEEIIGRLNGIFALAFYDSHTGQLLLARDHMGVKPLYYATGRNRRLLFASEIKALFATGEVEARVNVDDALELLMFHFIAGDRTAFATVRELPPGHLMRAHTGRTTLRQYWNVVTAARTGSQRTTDSNDGTADDSTRLVPLLRDAVHRQLMSDVPLGIMCSGGLDSSVVTAFAGGNDSPVTGLCYRDAQGGYDEIAAARSMAAPFGVTVDEVAVSDAEIPDLLTKLTWHYDEPVPRPHHIAAYAVARRAREGGLKVLLSGEGGDELFGGYQRHAQLTAQMTGSNDLTPLVFAHNRVALSRIGRFWSTRSFSNPYRFWCAEETAGFDLVNRQLLVDQKTFLQHFLQRSDRMGMAAGVEVRVPLLDIDLVEYTNYLPGDTKVRDGATKIGLKAAARQVLPDAVVDRPKQAFEMPMSHLLQQGPVAGLLNDVLLTSPRCGDLFDTQGIRAIVRDLRDGNTDYWKIVWLLLTFEIWMRVFRATL